jgi:hypothetical protein
MRGTRQALSRTFATAQRSILLHVVHAFTSQPFGENPAAVCFLESPLATRLMQKISLEINLPETALFPPVDGGFSAPAAGINEDSAPRTGMNLTAAHKSKHAPAGMKVPALERWRTSFPSRGPSNAKKKPPRRNSPERLASFLPPSD